MKLLNSHRKKIMEELVVLEKYQPVQKDILIVVHNQPEYIKNCLDSILANTKDYKVYIWDNNSDQETKEVIHTHPIQKEIVTSNENLGFIIPNNKLFSISKSPYVIMLNSDTYVANTWDKALIAQLQQDDNLAIVGYEGGQLKNMQGICPFYGQDAQYVSGWCMAFKRETIKDFGPFDSENLVFAYGEDSDLSLRVLEKGLSIKVLHLNLVTHFGNKTSKSLKNKELKQLKKHIQSNHEYLVRRHKPISN